MTADPLDTVAKVCDTRPGGSDDAVHGVAPGLVAMPATLAEASEMMRAAAERNLAVVVRGAGTALHWGMPPRRCDLVVDTTRLDRVVEHAAGDLVVKAEAGVPMAPLAAALAEQDQQLALDAPAEATVGGVVATDAGGPRRLLYGSARDLVIGITVVRADGVVARSGGKVVKNVAGYDLGKLFTGSHGTLGLIVEVTFRLHPLPRTRACLTVTADDGARATEAVRRVLESPVVPTAVEVDRPAPGAPPTIAVLLEGVPDALSARVDTTRGLLGVEAEVADRPPDWWGRYPAGPTLIEVAAEPTALSRLPGVIDAAGDVPAGLRGSAGGGHLYVGVAEATAPDRVSSLLTAIRRALDGAGYAVVRTAPADVRDELDPWGPVPALDLMRRVKDGFDPDHRLSPGRFVGGI